MQDNKLYTTQETEVSHRFDYDVRNKLKGDWEGLKITNYQITGEHAAERMYAVVGDTPILEVCTGIGATTFVLARKFSKVYAIDLDTDRLGMTKRNLKELNLLQNVELINGNILDEKILDYLSKKKINGVYSDVDWKKNNDWQDWVTDITTTGPNTVEMYNKIVDKITNNICMKLPETINVGQLRNLSRCEVESVKADGNLSFYLVYFGEFVKSESSEFVFPKRAYEK